jgi:hypothetical protein
MPIVRRTHYLRPHISTDLLHTQHASHIHTPPPSLDHATKVSWYWRKPQTVPTYMHGPCFYHNSLNRHNTTTHVFLPVLQASHALLNSLVLLAMGIMMPKTCWLLINQGNKHQIIVTSSWFYYLPIYLYNSQGPLVHHAMHLWDW